MDIAIVLRIGKKPEFAEHGGAPVFAQDVKVVSFDPAVFSGIGTERLFEDVRGETPRAGTKVVDFYAAGGLVWAPNCNGR